MKKHALYGLALIALAAAPTNATAGKSYCVTCQGPLQTYLCDVEMPNGSPGKQATQLFCVIQIAKQQNHLSCSVRKSQPGPCQGPTLNFTYSGPVISNPAGHNWEDDTPAPGKPKEPGTLVDLTKEAVKDTGQNIKNAGKAVGNATKKTGEFVKDSGIFVKDSAVKAGETVGDAAITTGQSITNAAKKSYKCLMSLFSDC